MRSRTSQKSILFKPFCGLLFAVASTLLAVSCGGNSPKTAQAQGPGAIPVKLQVTQSVPINDTTEYVATLRSRDSAVIMPQVEGQITEIFVHSGDHVAAGTPLMQIDPVYPEVSADKRRELMAAKGELEAQAPAGAPVDPFKAKRKANQQADAKAP